jgi:hypothetical protein
MGSGGADENVSYSAYISGIMPVQESLFDAIAGHLEEILMDPEFGALQADFCRERCGMMND